MTRGKYILFVGLLVVHLINEIEGTKHTLEKSQKKWFHDGDSQFVICYDNCSAAAITAVGHTMAERRA